MNIFLHSLQLSIGVAFLVAHATCFIEIGDCSRKTQIPIEKMNEIYEGSTIFTTTGVFLLLQGVLQSIQTLKPRQEMAFFISIL